MSFDDLRHGTAPRFPAAESLRELRFALAEADAEAPAHSVRQRVLDAALAARVPGRPSEPAEEISGLETFRRSVAQLDSVLEDLEVSEWSRPALRDLDVQGLVGHLIGVETAFGDRLSSSDPTNEDDDHISSTQAVALAQAGRPPAETLQSWRDQTERTLILAAAAADPVRPTPFYGIVLPLDLMLVVRAFEMWVHQEDIRRSSGRALDRPDPDRLARMTDLAMMLLPAGVVRAGRTSPGATARIVLTGPGGGTWDISLDQSVAPARRPSDVRVVVDAAAFCRAVGNRITLSDSGALVFGNADMAEDVFASAAALALD